MRKLIELVKRFALWVVKWWAKLINFCTSLTFVYAYPLGFFVTLTIVKWSLFWLVVTAIWTIPILNGIREE